MHTQRLTRQFRQPAFPGPQANVAALYDMAGDGYLGYADGDPQRLFAFEGPHAYADRQVWGAISKQLDALRAAGAASLSVVDAGCGPGTWLRRVVIHARYVGFARITARGFDVSEAQVQIARRMADRLDTMPGVDLRFDVGDLTRQFPEAASSVDITLCLYSVLSHVRAPALPGVAAEIARVTKGAFITTVRAIGSTPTVFVDELEKARQYKLDHQRGRYEVEFQNGRRIALSFRLFAARELRDCFKRHFRIVDLRGLDIFHTRFMPDRRWNPPSCLSDERLMSKLATFEEAFARDPWFIDRATHLLLVGKRAHPAERAPDCELCLGCR